VESDLLFGLGVRRYRVPKPEPVAFEHLRADGIGSVAVKRDRALDRGRFERFLKRLPSRVIRAKGVASIAGTPWRCVFNYACGRYEMDWVQWPGGPSGAEAVFIGKDIATLEPELADGLSRCEVD
jgi:G3E family GTPase